MDTREFLKKRLLTLDSLTRTGAFRRGSGAAGDVGAQLALEWETEKRLIKRVLAEPTEPTQTLLEWRDRTENFRDKFPERESWTDQQGNEWIAALVLKGIDNLIEHIENFSTEVEEFDDDGE